jgi:hypothetical protein
VHVRDPLLNAHLLPRNNLRTSELSESGVTNNAQCGLLFLKTSPAGSSSSSEEIQRIHSTAAVVVVVVAAAIALLLDCCSFAFKSLAISWTVF